MKPDVIMIEGRAYDWRQVLRAAQAQLEARRAAQGLQLALFALHDDCRPAARAHGGGAV